MQDADRPANHGRMAMLAALALSAAALGGCQDVLFPRDAPRTQFETYDRMRNRYAPTEQPDIFGRPQPALRERLSQK